MGEFTEEMGKFADLFWYYVGAGAVFTPLLFIESGGGYDSSLSDLPFAATILMTCLCLYYRPENPKRAALFGWLTLIGGGDCRLAYRDREHSTTRPHARQMARRHAVCVRRRAI